MLLLEEGDDCRLPLAEVEGTWDDLTVIGEAVARLAANMEPGAAPEFASMTSFWLRKALASAEGT